MRDSLQKETKCESGFLLHSFLIVLGVKMRPPWLAVTQEFFLGGWKDWEVTVFLPFSVQVQYSGPGSWEAAGVCWGIAGHWCWPEKERLHNSGTFQYHFACPREPIFVSYPCPGRRVQTYFGFADDHTIKRIPAQEAKKLPSVWCLYLKNYLGD